jgi:hypothetical protein
VIPLPCVSIDKYVNTETMFNKMSSDSVFTPKRPPVVFETLNHEYSIVTFIGHYQNAMPQLVMVRRGYCGETGTDTLDSGQVSYIYIDMSQK